MSPVSFTVRAATAADRAAIKNVIVNSWASTVIVAHGERIDTTQLPALVAVADDGQLLGVVTLDYRGDDCEIVTLDAIVPGGGVGSALLQAAFAEAQARGCGRVWLITSNDNLDAIRFYQRRGMRLHAVHQGAIDRARELKPSIPLIGDHGIPVRDELEFELRLGADPPG